MSIVAKKYSQNFIPRYVKQNDDYSCGPIAIINALKWIGRKASYGSLKRIQKACHCDEDGSSEWNLLRCLRKMGIDVRILHNPRAMDLDLLLEQGKSMIVSYYFKNNGYWNGHKGYLDGHYVFVSRKTKRRYVVHNDHGKSTLMFPRRRFLRFLTTGQSYALVISR